MIKLHENQKIIAQDKTRFRVVNCGRRFGKTVLACEEIKKRALYVACKGNLEKFLKEYKNEKPIQIAYIGPTYQQARDIAWGQMKRTLQDHAIKINESRMEITVPVAVLSPAEKGINMTPNVNTATVYLKGWESIESMRGMYMNFVVIDEIAMVRGFYRLWEETIAPTLTDYRGSVLFLSTPKGFNHFYDLYMKEKEDKDYKSFHFTSYDNPFLEAEEIDFFKSKLPEDRFAQEYLADFRKKEGLVYPEFNRKKHVFNKSDKLPDFKETILGVDFGYNAPASILEIAIDNDDNYWILSEWYQAGRTGAQIAQKAAMYKPNMVYPDPAEPDKVEDLRQAGLNVRDTNKDVINGIDKVRELFLQGRVNIAPWCRHLISELEMYSYREDDDKPQTDRAKETPVKGNDHCVDALRYALYTHQPVSMINQDFGLYAVEYD